MGKLFRYVFIFCRIRQNKDVFDCFYFFNILKKTPIFPLKIALDLGLGRTDKGTSDCPLLANYAHKRDVRDMRRPKDNSS